MNHFARHAMPVIAALSLALMGAAHAASPGEMEKIELTPSTTKAFVPRAFDTRPARVMVFLHGDPVAVVQSHVGRELSRAEKDSVIAGLRGQHSSMESAIQRHGGKVLAHLQSAINAIKVEIPRNKIAALRNLPGVVSVKPVGVYKLDNATSVPFIGAPLVWQLVQQYQGQGVKIGIIDTGIDYTHADFGGPGTVAAFTAAAATSTLPADPALFGPNAPKVKGGTDLVGDAYNAAAAAGDPALIPHPDPNPLDCNGHGSHVAGTATGFGVTAAGTTYTGPYNAAAYTPGAFSIGPGVAPKADLYSIRVFGCTGSTDVVSEAIDWAVGNGMNVISMSLGSDFGDANADVAEATAVANANSAGIIVIAASGNSGQIPYITSAPAAIDGAVSVAATDVTASYPGAVLALSSGVSITVQDSNGAPFAAGTVYPIVVLRNSDGTVSLGCNEAEYDKTRNGGLDITGKLVVTMRSTCARVYRAGAGQHYGAAAVAMINSSAGYPAYEGPIPGGDPAANPFEPVTIPFFGVLLSDKTALTGPTGGPAPASATATPTVVANPGFELIASFSSGGPRIGDSFLRPGITGPGVSIVSAASGTGNGSITESGTSMATPHVAGVSALVKQANPTWSLNDIRSAVLQTAAPSKMLDYLPRNEGSGLVQPLPAISTQAVARTPNDSVSFGYSDLLTDFSATRSVTIHNAGTKAVQFNLSATPVSGPASATLTIPASVIVPGSGDASFNVTLAVPAASVGGTHAANGACCLFQDVSGYIKATPSNLRLNNGVSLTVPYYLAGHSRSNLSTSATSLTSLPVGAGNLTVTNASGAIAGTPDYYSMGLYQPTPQGVRYADTRAVGVKAAATTTGGVADSLLTFAINTHDRFSNAAGFLEWDVSIYTTGGSSPDYVLIGYNGIAFSTAASVQNVMTAALLNTTTGAITALRLADVATDNSTLLLQVKASELGLSTANPRFFYTEAHFSTDGTSAGMPGVGYFNAFTPAVTVVGSGAIAPNASGTATVTVNSAEYAVSPPLGLMIVAPDNVQGASQARIVPSQRATN